MIRFLYTVTLMELFVGGGGRLLAAGPVSARMVLFALCVLIGFSALLARRVISEGQKLAVLFVLAYLAVHLPGLANGAIHAKDAGDMFQEFQQSLYWLAAPFYAVVLHSEKMVIQSARLVQTAALLLAFGYLGVLAAGALGLVDILSLYSVVNETGEFAGRGEGLFFYKGFLYLGIGIVFVVGLRAKHWLFLSMVLMTALVATLTRGFVLSTAIATLLLLVTQKRRGAAAIVIGLAAMAGFVVLFYLPSLNEGIGSSQSASSGQRIEDASYMALHARALTFMIGEGFGSLINDREFIENTFFWVTWKLGFAGLIFWLTPLVLIVNYFFRIPSRRDNRLACVYLYGTVLVYVQTMTNPFLNNPIGLSFVMLALFSMQTLSRSGSADRQMMQARKDSPLSSTIAPRLVSS